MELKDYIEKRGEESLAKELKVSVSTVRSWRYSTRQPSVNQAKKYLTVVTMLQSLSNAAFFLREQLSSDPMWI